MYLVDTNIISELARPNPNAGVVAWAKTTSSVGLSVVTVEEILFGLHWKPVQRIQNWFEGFLNAHCKIYPITDEIARCSGRLRGALAANGRTHTQADMLIAATAQVERQTLVTRNVRDFEGCGIPVYDPFA
ncbi:MAG: type II toxin-antitoxin system VapC family toxin [Gammaproteobacteria bacterium]